MRSLCRIVAVLLLAAGCGGKTDTTQPSSETPYQITISAAGIVSPAELVVPPGARVLFVNSHGREHLMSSDPHPDHFDCPAINQAGLLLPGQRRETGNLVDVGSWGFHDHENPDDRRLQGLIIVR
jgi:hypothetical protein